MKKAAGAVCVWLPRDKRLEDLELDCTLYVKTLGGFSLRYSHPAGPDAEFSERDGGSWRQQAFLQYLCVNHQRSVPQEEIIDILWDDDEIGNPANALKTLLHRTRLTLERLGFKDGKKTLLCRRGGYTWDSELNIQLDIEQFDALCARFDAAPNTEEGVQAAKQALALYEGDFLPQAAASIWALSPRTYYHSKYLRLCCDTANALWGLERLPEAIELCQMATALDPYDESCQMLMMRLLHASGAKQAVAQYYNDVSSLLMSQLGVSPSPEMTALYHELSTPDQAQELDLRTIRTIVLGEDLAGKGAFFCEYYVFQNICRLLARTTARSGQIVQLGVITVFPRRGDRLTMNQRTAAMSDLKAEILENLRSGDIFTQFSLTQYLLLLPTASHENGSMAVNRVLEAFSKRKSSAAAVPRFSLLPALSMERRIPVTMGFRPMNPREN